MSKFIYNFEVEARKSVNYSFKVCSCLLEGSISQLVKRLRSVIKSLLTSHSHKYQGWPKLIVGYCIHFSIYLSENKSPKLLFPLFVPLQVVESLLGESGDLIQTGSPCILCTPLPNHWRSNKSLPSAFKVFTFQVCLTIAIVTPLRLQTCL